MDQGVRKGAKRMETTKKERLCYIRPVRAFRRMKSADEDSQTVYIFGVTGIGKTELFTRYLDGMEYRLLNGRKIDPEALKPEKRKPDRSLSLMIFTIWFLIRIRKRSKNGSQSWQ